MASTISEHSTTSTTSANSFTAATGIENREVSSSPVSSSNLSLALSYDIGYSTSPDLKSLNTSFLTNSTNDHNVEKESEHETGINQDVPFISNLSPENSPGSRNTAPESKLSSTSPPPPYSPFTSNPSKPQIDKQKRYENPSDDKRGSDLCESPNTPSSHLNEIPTPPSSPGVNSTQV